MEDFGSKFGARFIRGRYLSLVTVLVLFFLWMVSVGVLLSKAKVSEKISVHGRFGQSVSGKKSTSEDQGLHCFSGRLISGFLYAHRGEKFSFSVRDDELEETIVTLNAVVDEWRVQGADIFLCLWFEESSNVLSWTEERDRRFTFTVRRKSLLHVTWKKYY